jgi:putative SOS response-associated peptidase YedK
MCGRYTYLLSWQEIRDLYGLTAVEGNGGGGDDGGAAADKPPPDFKKRYNLPPTERAPVVRVKNAKRELVMLRWGWGKPSWSPNREWINARAEGIESSRNYADSFRSRRCLVPVSGYYEWRKMPSGRRAPHWIGMADRAPFALAGIWREIGDPKTGELMDAYLVITCAPNELMAQVHDRMPLIIDPADYDRWLSADPAPLDLLKPYPAAKMTAYEVSTKINKAGYDAPDILDPSPPIRDDGPPAPELPL